MFYASSIRKQTKQHYFVSSPKISCMDYMDSQISVNGKALKSFSASLFNTNHTICTFLSTTLGNLHRGAWTGGECS